MDYLILRQTWRMEYLGINQICIVDQGINCTDSPCSLFRFSLPSLFFCYYISAMYILFLFRSIYQLRSCLRLLVKWPKLFPSMFGNTINPLLRRRKVFFYETLTKCFFLGSTSKCFFKKHFQNVYTKSISSTQMFSTLAVQTSQVYYSIIFVLIFSFQKLKLKKFYLI